MATESDANFRQAVSLSRLIDPRPTLENLARNTGLTYEDVVHHALVRYAASGAEALLAIEPQVLRELFQRWPDAWRSAISHPFLDAIRGGTLPMSAFRAWLAQDYVFVCDELRFQAGVLRIAPRPAWAVLSAGLAALEAELTWFETQAEWFAISVQLEADAVTRRYRDFMEESLSFGWARSITTLWTLERAYLEAWRGAAPGGGDYREFVEHWTAPAFADYVKALEQALGEAGDESAFRRTTELERDFWEM